MANPYRGEVDVTINGRQRRMVFTGNTIANIEEQLDASVFQLFSTFEEADKAPLTRVLRVCLWAGLAEAKPGIKLRSVGAAMRFDEYAHYAEQCMRGILKAYGQDFDELQENAEDRDPLGPVEEPEGEGPFLVEKTAEGGLT